MSYAVYVFHYVTLYALNLPPWPCDGTTGNPSLDDLKLGSRVHLLNTSTTKDDAKTKVLFFKRSLQSDTIPTNRNRRNLQPDHSYTPLLLHCHVSEP